jgi:hypothetical protein
MIVLKATLELKNEKIVYSSLNISHRESLSDLTDATLT